MNRQFNFEGAPKQEVPSPPTLTQVELPPGLTINDGATGRWREVVGWREVVDEMGPRYERTPPLPPPARLTEPVLVTEGLVTEGGLPSGPWRTWSRREKFNCVAALTLAGMFITFVTFAAWYLVS
jgi:hypothetical protein